MLTLTPLATRSDITLKELRRDYIKTSTPIVLDNFASNWPALKKWTPAYLTEHYGALNVDVYDNSFESVGKNYLKPKGKMAFSEYLNLIISKPTSLRLFLFKLLDKAPELKKDIIISKDIGNVSKRFLFLFFGGAGGSPPMHYDLDLPHNFHTLIWGKKRVMLFPPEQSENIYQHPFTVRSYVDFDNPDYSKFPKLAEARGYECILEAGQTLFIPSGYWHKINYLEGSCAISFRQYTNLFKNLPIAFYNLFIQETIDKCFNSAFGQKWFDFKTRWANSR